MLEGLAMMVGGVLSGGLDGTVIDAKRKSGLGFVYAQFVRWERGSGGIWREQRLE